MPNGTFATATRVTNDFTKWTHFVLNFDVKQQELGLYQDGTFLNSNGMVSDEESRHSGDGRIVVGRSYTIWRRGYASVEVDELLFFNQLLPEAKIRILSQQMCIACGP